MCVAVGGGIEPLSSVRLLLRYWFRRPVPVHRLLYTNLEGVLYPTELQVLETVDCLGQSLQLLMATTQPWEEGDRKPKTKDTGLS